MFCMRCGTKLGNGKCPNCGYVYYNKEISKIAPESEKSNKKWKWLILVVAASVIIIEACSILVVFFYKRCEIQRSNKRF